MFSTLKTATLAAVVGVTAFTGMAAAAKADGLYLNFGGGEPRVGVYVGDGSPRHVGRWERDRWDRGDRWDRWGRGRECTPGRALDKAERMGIRRARVVDVDRRSIDVAGRKFGNRVVVTFARAPYCPVVR